MSGETEDNISGWTTDTLRADLQRQINTQAEIRDRQIGDLRDMLQERYATQTKALDAAFAAAEKSVATALDSAEKAVVKAETAAEKRFEAVNEFRGQLADQAATFIGRNEAEARILALAEKLDANQARTDQSFKEINQRLDRMQGSSAGTNKLYGWMIAAAGLIVSVVIMANVLSGR